MADSKNFSGTGVAMVTPFSKNGNIDYDKLSMHTENLIINGVDFLVVLGTTAETPTLSEEEKKDVIRCAVDACGGRVKLVVGAGGNNTRAVINEIRAMDQERIDGFLCVVPYYNKPSQEGIYQHYSAIAAVSELPLMLYNVPGRTGTNMLAQTVLRLAWDHPGKIAALKEASGSHNLVSEIIRDKPSGFQVLSGDDSLTLTISAIGGNGVVSVIGNAYPELFSSMVNLALQGDFTKALEVHLKLFPMMMAIFREGNPAGIKAAMEIRGMIAVSYTHLRAHET